MSAPPPVRGARAGSSGQGESIVPALVTGVIILGGIYWLSKGPSSQAAWNKTYGRRYMSDRERREEEEQKYSGSWRDRAAMALGMKGKRDYEEEDARDAYMAKRARRSWAGAGAFVGSPVSSVEAEDEGEREDEGEDEDEVEDEGEDDV